MNNFHLGENRQLRTIYLQAAVLTQCSTALVLGLDDVDSLFEFPQVAAGFFALLRSWYEEANSLEIWQKLRLIVAHSTEVYIPLKLNQSPFNVGLPVRLPNLTIAQIDQLALRYQLRWTTEASAKLYALTGGHPYLVQLALYHLADAQLQGNPLTLTELLQLAPTQSGIYASHLRHHWQMLRTEPDLLRALTQLLEGSACLEPSIAYRLESIGLIWLEGNLAHISCELYRQFFRSLVHLINGEISDNQQ